jgi:hypothetical protein
LSGNKSFSNNDQSFNHYAQIAMGQSPSNKILNDLIKMSPSHKSFRHRHQASPREIEEQVMTRPQNEKKKILSSIVD